MLTDAKLRAFKPASRSYKASDGEGLFVLIKPTGSKLWRLSYRFHGKQKTLALGAYPQVSLLEARKRRLIAREQLGNGEDPAQLKRKAKRQARVAAGNTFRIVAEEWFARETKELAESYRSRLRTRLDDDLMPDLGNRPIAAIEPIEVLDTIRKIEARGAIEMAKRVKQMASNIFKYGVATMRCQRDPTADISNALLPAGPVKARKGLKAKELPEFFARLRSTKHAPLTRLALEIVVLTFVRTEEIRFAKWDEFEDLDGTAPLWRIPAERMKMERPHLVPLAPAVVELLKELRKLTNHTQLLFPAKTRSKVISENTMLFAMYRMGYHGKATVHGFRKTASTILNEHQYNRDWIEMQLAHADDTVRGDYNEAEYLPMRREMMCWYADHLRGFEASVKLALVAA
ncbi:MAG: DUF4102 domain-containing protein [Verrucomicrobiaceae bacterium]|nr:MAG: DUF4102 domain-containing protein [Verrucomicrobiaceae bacterium]